MLNVFLETKAGAKKPDAIMAQILQDVENSIDLLY